MDLKEQPPLLATMTAGRLETQASDSNGNDLEVSRVVRGPSRCEDLGRTGWWGGGGGAGDRGEDLPGCSPGLWRPSLFQTTEQGPLAPCTEQSLTPPPAKGWFHLLTATRRRQCNHHNEAGGGPLSTCGQGFYKLPRSCALVPDSPGGRCWNTPRG